ncbi:uncharacterized protein VTP21DRAFT_11544 [Calcarisporiella thermophila]|uniref:uncharacterized protein n=1 Tax=Calcarisporiella thermophila TaxID=911321 RepID=UPI003743F8D1
MKIIIKGGVWKNTEDEILKAAVSKYGKNQWARISSLLVRKTPKQCKARWYEWLDPGIKKTEWSREEDEKLLHLAKLMPTQWRTIAPIVGRTPAQCLERYQKLLDEAEQKEGVAGELGLAGPSGGETMPAEDVRRLRPGEIDPEPESKPARPDPVDMDEDEKEMLSEARARLANTQGKKAKRKAREKQLEEARRLASLQKRRELKAAGIEVRQKKKKKGTIDYNADIPFEKKPLPGPYDTSEERSQQPSGKMTNVLLQKLEGKRRAEIEEEERKKDAKRLKSRKEKNGAGFVPSQNQLNKLKEAEQITNRRKLVLPEPQVGERELEEIIKIGYSGENARAIVEENENTATSNLVGNYSALNQVSAARTPRTPAAADTIRIEARNLRALTSAQTPLLGDENTILEDAKAGTGFDGITPRHSISQTPNPLMTPLRGATPATTSQYRKFGQTPLRTPFRDELSINADDAASIMETPREFKMRHAAQRNQLRQTLMNLPAPKNEIEIELPEEEEQATEEVDEEMEMGEREEDAADVERRLREEQEREEQYRFKLRSLAVQKELPRPLISEIDIDDEDEEMGEINRMIKDTLIALLEHDAIKYPAPGSKIAGGGEVPVAVEEEFTLEELDLARSLVLEEVALLEESSDGPLPLRPAVIVEKIRDPSTGKHVPITELGKDDLLQAFEEILNTYREAMGRDSKRAEKIENKLNIVHGGYIARSKTIRENLAQAIADLDEARIEYESFRMLAAAEKEAIPRRIEGIRGELDRLSKRELELQQRYADLMREREDLQERLKAQ